MTIEKKPNHLNRLSGEQLISVQVVQDYLQLHFDGNGITCYIWPDINLNNQIYKFGNIDYRNKLCELIAKIVRKVRIIENELLTIEFEDNSQINLSLDSNNPEIVAEIAIFSDLDGNLSYFE